MAAQGLRFTNGYAASPICSPSRAALMTGRSPAALGITEHFRGTPPVERWQRLVPPDQEQSLPLSTTTVAEVARDAGYVTAHMGKWHLGYQGSLPTDHGFEINVGGSGRGLPPTFFYPYLTGSPERDLLGEPVDPSREGEYLTDRLGTEAVEFLEAHADTTFPAPPRVLRPARPHRGGRATSCGSTRRRRRRATTGSRTPSTRRWSRAIDRNVGRVLDALDRLGLADETLVVFLSDNGGLSVEEVPAFAQHTPATFNGPLRAGKGYLYEGGTRVPFIAWGPGVRSGTSDVPVTNMDLLSTAAEWIGAPVPPEVEGVSLVPLLTGAAPPARTVLSWYFPHYSPQGTRPVRSIREGSLKLVEPLEFGRPARLYDLAADPGETTDLAAERPDDVERLRAQLDAILDRQGAQPTRRNPTYSSEEPVPDRWATPNS